MYSSDRTSRSTYSPSNNQKSGDLLHWTKTVKKDPSQSKKFKMESTRKLSNFNSQWTKILYQNNLKNIEFFFYIFQGLKMQLVICNNTKENFLWEPGRENECQISQNCILHMRFQKFTCVFTILVKFGIHFLGLP